MIILCFVIIMLIFYTGSTKSSAKSSNSFNPINTQKFEELIKEKENVWVYIGRPTCDDCDRFSPVLKEVIKENNKKVYYYNTDEARKENEEKLINHLNKLGVKSVPTLIYFKKGEVVKTVVGYQDKASVEKLLKDYESR